MNAAHLMNGERLDYLPFRSLQRQSDWGNTDCGLRASLVESREANPDAHIDNTHGHTHMGDRLTN